MQKGKKTEKAEKKPFVEPRLIAYGNLQAITNSLMGTGATDGGAHPTRNKTH
jgi:hypothetical protein